MTQNNKGWIGFDLDGTLAHAPDSGLHSIGGPIAPMVDLVKKYLKEGYEVKIVTARAAPPYLDPEGFQSSETEMIKGIQSWCEEHIGQRLTITCSKDQHMKKLYDDRAIQVVFNTGEIVGSD